ncbi:hypothetical protein CROQUDRAFT_664465 [Cronartium quercuum f. sp. fusiforme G11]|uniref:Uncharacterized protein n=1 Tax=Cronartium quercuum f. sp. fusiforme G11 TaxID=708437 RepID=A0A9P6T7Z4_9BASI|nr:hypothetical protein CROQUDRAFT_664465 [Cronartium quercuum f. sp. fusiforme G11]
MSTTTTSYASSLDSNSHKKRSSKATASLNPYKHPNYIGKWKRRPVRTPLRITPQEEREAQDLLRSLEPKKDFSLPPGLPAWKPPPEGLGEISSELRWFRDYSEPGRSSAPAQPQPSSGPVTVRSLPSTVQASDESNGADEDRRAPTESPSRKPDDTHERSVAPRASTSSASSPHARVEPTPEVQKPSSPKSVPPPVVTTVVVNGKGKGKAAEADLELTVDWSDWRAQTYVPKYLAELRFKYAERAKDLKRLSERQMRDLHHSYEQSSVEERGRLDRKREIAMIQMVDSLLLFTQSFLCQDVDPNTSPLAARRSEFLRQWESMVMFLHAVKGTAKRSGIDLAYAICLMYEGLLLHRLTDAERPLLLQLYGQATEPEKQAEAYKKFKNLLTRQENGQQSFATAQTTFQRLFATSLPKLAALTSLMRPRVPGESPLLMSMDGAPWRFCWPIERDDGLADFVAFARAGLEEWLERSSNTYKLEDFGDRDRLFRS